MKNFKSATTTRRDRSSSKKRRRPPLPGHLPPQLTSEQTSKLPPDKRAKIIDEREYHTITGNPLWKTERKIDTGGKTTSLEVYPTRSVMPQNPPPIPPQPELLTILPLPPPQIPLALGIGVQTLMRPRSNAVVFRPVVPKSPPPPPPEALLQRRRKPPPPQRIGGTGLPRPPLNGTRVAPLYSKCRSIIFSRKDKQDGRQASDVHAVGQDNLTTSSQVIKDQHVTNWRR